MRFYVFLLFSQTEGLKYWRFLLKKKGKRNGGTPSEELMTLLGLILLFPSDDRPKTIKVPYAHKSNILALSFLKLLSRHHPVNFFKYM